MPSFIQSVFHDVRIAVRQLLRQPTIALGIVLTLALGISANTSMFALADALLFKPPVAADPARLIAISGGDARGAFNPLSYPDYLAIRQQARTLDGVMAFSGADVALGGVVPERLRAMLVSGNYFDVLGEHAEVGRTFIAAEDATRDEYPVVVLSHNLWVRRFNRDAHVVDSTIMVNGQRFSVVGVAPAGFSGLEFDESSDMFVPMAMIARILPGQSRLLDEERSQWVRTAARLAPGATIEGARAELQGIARQFDSPTVSAERRKAFAAARIAGGLDPSNRHELAPIMALLEVVPLLILVVACANAANMLLARGFARRREFAVRRALGASRARVMRQLLTESLLLATVAGAVGIVGSLWLTKGIIVVSSVPESFDALLAPNVRVLVATTLLAMTSGVLFGIAPALAAVSPALVPSLKAENGTLIIGKRRRSLRSVLVVGQVTVSLTLVVTAGLFLKSLDKALRVDPGFEARNAASVSFDLGMQGYTADARATFERNALERAASLPGITSAALSTTLPLSGRVWSTDVRAESNLADNGSISSGLSVVSSAYLRTMRVALMRGRDFTDDDRTGGAPVVIIDETLANRLWPDGSAVGKRLRIDEKDEPLREVIGIARAGHYRSLVENPQGFMYLPLSQYRSFTGPLSLIVRTEGDPVGVLPLLARLFKTLDANLPVYNVQTLQHAVVGAVDKQRAAAALLGIFGTVALLLAASGMYGVIAQGIALRKREIGIRMSLGARTSNVLALFVGEGLRYSMIGVGVGLVISAAISQVLASFLFGLAPTDAGTFAGGALVLCVVSGVASYLPARRAATLDPLIAMRSD